MKKGMILSLSLLLVLSGCVCKRKKCGKKVKTTKMTEVAQEVTVPVAGDEALSYFEDKDVNLGGFVLVEDDPIERLSENDIAGIQLKESINLDMDDEDKDVFAWIEQVEGVDQDFNVSYFDFDKYSVRPDQEAAVEANIATAKRILEEGGNPQIIIEGHACSASGSRVYNMVLSEKRAKVIADRFAAAGIPMGSIKVVARGMECPALNEQGEAITGDRVEQALNRRSEVHVIYT